MKLTNEEKRGVLVVRVENERLDAHIASDFRQAMSDHIERGHARLVLDLVAVNFIDSSGLGAIVAVLKKLGGKGALVISGLHDSTLAMFKLTRMDRVFSLYDDIDAAVTAVSG